MPRTPQHILNTRRRLRTENASQQRQAQELLNSGIRFNNTWAKTNDRPNAVRWAVTKAAMSVINSYGITPPIEVGLGDFNHVEAYTNFSKIVINLPYNDFETDDTEKVGRSVFFLKGLLYHEAGHILHTTPLADLATMAGVDVASITPKLRTAWNALEDQRMETKMCMDSPIMERYFTVIVSDFVVRHINDRAWLLVAGRKYLPRAIRKAAKEAAMQSPVLAERPEMVTEAHDIIEAYKAANTPSKMWDCVVQFADIVGLWKGEPTKNFDNHGESSERVPSEEYLKKIEESATDEQEDDTEEQEGDGVEEVSDKKDAEPVKKAPEDQDGMGDFYDTPTSEESPTQSQSHSNDSAKDNNDSAKDIKDAADDAIQEVLDNQDLDELGRETLSDINQELNSSLVRNTFVTPLPEANLRSAEEVTAGMVSTLEELISHADPSWQFGKEEGIFDPVRYLMAESCDTDYWINVDDSGARGFDLSVSLLLDVSGSIGHKDVLLGESAFAIRKACDLLEIPCSVTTFDTFASTLWKSTEEALPVYAKHRGATNIGTALTELSNQKMDKTNHLVIIFTDGDWSDIKSLAPFYEQNRHFLLVGLGAGMAYTLKKLGAHSYTVINTPRDLPQKVTQELKGFA